MSIIITLYGTTISRIDNISLVPRIGDEIRINKNFYTVKNVVWHIENIIYAEIEVE